MAKNADNLYPSVGNAKTDGVSPKEKGKMGDQESKPNTGLRALYWREVERYQRSTSSWYELGDNIIDIYLGTNRTQNSVDSSRKFALLWANVETLKPAVYTKVPSIECTRRFKDRDPIARTAAELMERATNSTFDLYNVDETLRMVRDDRLLPGRGQAWVRYSATLEEYEVDEGGVQDDDDEPDEDAEPQTAQRLKSQHVCVDYVHWKDFGHNNARTWSDVWLVWRIVYMTKEEVEERFGDDVASKLTYNAKSPNYGSGASTDDPDMRAKVYEMWDKRRSKTSWIAEGYAEFLETGDPPIKFQGGFPCPEPCYATKTSKELIPKPDYEFYRDQAREINDLTDKIGRMTQWLVVKGFIPNGPSSMRDPLEEVLRDKTNAELFVGVDSMTEWAEKGGAAKLIDWLPIEAIVKAIQAAIQARAQLIQDVFQITGISDVLRGQTNPNETLGAQELKSQTGSRRLRNAKDEIARFCRDIAALVAEVIAEQYEPQTIADITGFQYIPSPPMQDGMQIFGPGQPLPPTMGLPLPGPAPFGAPLHAQPQGQMPGPQGMLPPNAFPGGIPGQMPQQATTQHGPDQQQTFDDRHIQLLRDDRMRSFRIDVETDSTIMADEQAEKQSAMEFLSQVGGYLQQAIQVVESAPALSETVGAMLMMAVRRFRVGTDLEDTIEKGFQMVEQQIMQQKQQPPPELAVKQQELQQKGQNDQAKLQQHGQIEQAKLITHQQEVKTAAALDTQQQHIDAALTVRQQNLDAQAKLRDTHASASAKAQDRAARILQARSKPTGTLQ